MDLAGRLQQLEEIVREAKSMPLSSSALVNREEVLEMLTAMQEDLPDEFKQARWIVKDREDLLDKARTEGDRIVEQAQQEQLRMARQQEVARAAGDEAERILHDAETRAESMQREAEDYVDAKLAQLEIALRKILEESQASTKALARTLDQIEAGRDRLRSGAANVAEQEFAPHEDAGSSPELFDEEDR